MARLTLLGVEVDPLTIEELNGKIAAAVASGERAIIAHHNLHSVYLYHRDGRMRDFYARAQVAHIDGMPLIWLGRLLGYPLYRTQRVTYVDWVHPLMREAHARGWRIFYLGSKPGVASQAAQILMAQFPGLEIHTRHGYFDMNGPENESVLAEIRHVHPDILMVGMGMPRQERWIVENLERIEACAILTSGACFDYIAGAIPTPPRWMGHIGLEWLFRLLTEPQRLWRRYLVEPCFLLPFAAKDIMHRLGSTNTKLPPS